MKYWMAMVACGLACTAQAQSDVRIYGIVDGGVRYNSNVGGTSQTTVGGGNESASRIGFTGSEDLGDGYKAIFTLEGGFTTNNGALSQGGLLFGRQAFVGLSTPQGTLTLGRHYPTLATYLGEFASGTDWAARGTGWGYHPGGVDDVDGTERVNDSLKYASPRYHGLQAGATYSPGAVAANGIRNEIVSAGAFYDGGPFKAAVAYLRADNPNFSLFGNNGNSSATARNITSPVFSGYATAAVQRVLGTGASYAFGRFTAGAIYTHTAFANLGGAPVTGVTVAPAQRGKEVAFNTAEANLRYAVTPLLQLATAYAWTRASAFMGQSGASYGQWHAGARYLLSKRTDLYFVVLRQSAAGFDSTGRRAVAVLTFATPSSTDRQTGIIAGIRHNF